MGVLRSVLHTRHLDPGSSLGEVLFEMALRESSDAGDLLVATAPDAPAARAIAKAAADSAAALAVLDSLG
ncbi:MAG: hypothetical protein ACM3OG_02030 [Actinomycetota bacterium]